MDTAIEAIRRRYVTAETSRLWTGFDLRNLGLRESCVQEMLNRWAAARLNNTKPTRTLEEMIKGTHPEPELDDDEPTQTLRDTNKPPPNCYDGCAFLPRKTLGPAIKGPYRECDDDDAEHYDLGGPQAFCRTSSKYADDAETTRKLSDHIDQTCRECDGLCWACAVEICSLRSAPYKGDVDAEGT
uniref:Uncharacterized protein n=1 Tax=viral metagenome TaxID=1070528 RepID=A0A6H1ZTW9_9ZZZZ